MDTKIISKQIDIDADGMSFNQIVQLRLRPTARSSEESKSHSPGQSPERSLEEKGKPEKPTVDRSDRMAKPTWSSTVVFYPPSEKYWRIGNKWYDLTTFKHPGGTQILEMARDRFDDATFAFEAHHHNIKAATKILNKYQVPEEELAKNPHLIKERPTRKESAPGTAFDETTHHDSQLDANRHPDLLNDEDGSFYSVVRQRVAAYLKEQGCKDGGPTWVCLGLFWIVFFAWVGMMLLTYQTGSFVASFFTGIVGSYLGSFGHNWVHQPKYKHMGFALLSLDTVGFSSEQWYRDHVLHHHMYTNTPWDHHLHGSDPFMPTDPRKPRDFLQRNVYPYLFHVFLCFGTYSNYMRHNAWCLKGEEEISIGKLFFPLWHYLFYLKWGWMGVGLVVMMTAVTGNYFYTIALMNHNADNAVDFEQRNNARDWGEAQLICSADFCTHFNFYQAMSLLLLNFHTVHHLFPKVDFCHHPAISQILTETCKEFDIPYRNGSPVKIYKEMIKNFATQTSSVKEVLVYAGGV